ncbi:MAG TPA: hypothetical protein PK796_05880, partial [Bacteroidales bacterium]|nr:hypothetical protein [Bacteroidales bacterium]
MKPFISRTLRGFLTAFLCWPLLMFAQIEQGGIPRSFTLKSSPAASSVVDISPPNADSIAIQDYRDAMLEKPYRMGVVVPVSFSMDNNGVWSNVAGGRLWILHLRCKGARALTLYYDRFFLPEGSDLFIYSPGGKDVAGAFTPVNNTGNNSFATRLIPGEETVLEYFEPYGCDSRAEISISGVLYVYRSAEVPELKNGDDYGGSGSCEVNVNCTEGDSWKDQKQGIARVLTRIGSSAFWCSGSLLNNTQQDFSPVFITASHCALNEYNAQVATISDLQQWIFYFNYES